MAMTVWEHYDRMAEVVQDRRAVVDQQGQTLTHSELRERAVAVGSGFGELGLNSGDIIGVFLPNRSAWPIIALGAAYQGIGVLGLNTRFREAELNHLLAVADVQTVVVADEFLGIDGPELMGRLDRPVRCVVVTIDDQPLAEANVAVASGNRDHRTFAELLATAPSGPVGRPDDPLIGFTTSGTTGFPKVAMHNQRQALSHLLNVADSFAITSDSVSLTPLPLCGAFGYTVGLATLLAGGTVVAHETWEADVAAEAIDACGVTYFSASDDMLLGVLGSERFDPSGPWQTGGFADFTNSGVDAVTAAETSTEGRLRLTGLYGSSEGFALMSTWAPDTPFDDRVRNGGYLVGADMSVRCCDPESGAELPPGEPGELQFQGNDLITGYLNNPEATAKAFTEDGWYRSGDLGYTVDSDERGHQGFVFLARLGDSLRLRGFLCDPAEIEHHLEGHPAVDLAQVVGVKRPGQGDVAVGFVRLADSDGESPSEADLLEHCRNGLANYKRPERVVVVDQFPVTDGPNGVKIRKVELRDQAAEIIGQ